MGILATSCTECSSEIIDQQSLLIVCSPDSPAQVTYRARLEGTSQASSSSLISLIEEWVSGEPSVTVKGATLRVDSGCPVAISSLDEKECEQPTTDSTTDSSTGSDSSSSTSDNTAALVGAVVAVTVVVLIIVCTAAIVTIVCLVVRHRRKKQSLKDSEK